MQIIEYEDKYLEDVRDLLTELEEYIVSIDKDQLDQVHPEYHEKMALIDLEDVKNNNGICYLAIETDKPIGLIMGTIPPYDEYDYLICMDTMNIRNAERITGHKGGKIKLMLSFCGRNDSVIDPWYSNKFDDTYRDIDEGCDAFLNYLRENGQI